MKNDTIIRKAKVLKTGKLINARWDGVNCIWRDNDRDHQNICAQTQKLNDTKMKTVMRRRLTKRRFRNED